MSAHDAAAQDGALDHLIVHVPDLKRGIARFVADTGIVAVRGGQHPGRGTENALVSLGPGRYLELLAPIEKREGNAHDSTLRLGGWAVRSDDLAMLIQRVSAAGLSMSAPQPGSRRMPTGALLEWRTAALLPPGIQGAPFVIEWRSGTPHPSGTAPEGCRSERLEIETPEAAQLSMFLRAAGSSSPVRQAALWRMQAVLACPTGRVVLTS